MSVKPVFNKFSFLYDPYVLAIVSIGRFQDQNKETVLYERMDRSERLLLAPASDQIFYFLYVTGELGHYLIGVTSKAIANELNYGDITCQLISTVAEFGLNPFDVPVECRTADNNNTCLSLQTNGTSYCEWSRNGLGLDYQLLAGPAFIAVFTIVGVILGFAADKYNRARLLAICTIIFGVAIFFSGSVTKYWHLVILRMIMAAGESACNPMATGILSDIFPEEKRGLVMSIFNWGIYGGYGIAFPVGRYIPGLDIWGLNWRFCYYAAGIIAVIIGVVTMATLWEPERKAIGEDAKNNKNSDKKDVTENGVWQTLLQPRMVLLCIAASVRHCGGMCFAYNCDLYYRQYFPEYDLGWWLFAVTIGIGSIGVVAGGIISDKIVSKLGVRSRVACLAISQLLATPFAFGSIFFEPTWAMITLGISYFFAEMWFGIVFAILVEIVPLKIRSTLVGIFLFVMNNIGGNLPILVDPVSKYVGYRESIAIFYAGFYGLSAILFFITMYAMEKPMISKSIRAKEAVVVQGYDNYNYNNTENIEISHF